MKQIKDEDVREVVRLLASAKIPKDQKLGVYSFEKRKKRKKLRK